jgi:hypothetical protein
MDNIETNDLETHLLECYLFVDDYLQSNPKVADWRRSNNSDPDFTDAEVIVIALMQGYFRTDTSGADLRAGRGQRREGVSEPRWIQAVDSAPAATARPGWSAGPGRCSARARRRGTEALRGGLTADSVV